MIEFQGHGVHTPVTHHKPPTPHKPQRPHKPSPPSKPHHPARVTNHRVGGGHRGGKKGHSSAPRETTATLEEMFEEFIARQGRDIGTDDA